MLRRFLIYTILSAGIIFINTQAQSETVEKICDAKDRSCLTRHLSQLAEKIEKDRWRDQTYRELAKTLASDGKALEAISYIEKIINPDTKALTIRGIGVEAAMSKSVPEGLFLKLRTEADKIDHPPSYGIALTYIAMAQAFAGDDAGATKTAKDMENAALRNKAFGETAEIQAEQGKFRQAIESISYIESQSFRNKAHKIVSKIFAEDGLYQESFDTALLIENPVMQSEAIQFILNAQKRDKEQK